MSVSNQTGTPRHLTPFDPTGSVLLVATCWWPSLARLAHLLVLAGCRVSVLAPPGHPARMVPGVRVFEQKAFRPLQALSAAIAAAQPGLVVPADDRATAGLHQLHRSGSDTERGVVRRSLGSPEGYAITTSRIRLLALARRLGLAVPDGGRIETDRGC